jgi:hypothetical protein
MMGVGSRFSGGWAGVQKADAEAVALAPDVPTAYYSWGVALAKHRTPEGRPRRGEARSAE